MSAQRAFHMAFRRAATNGLIKFSPAGRRYAATEAVSQETGNSILAKQRLARPVSPHLSIYRPQITWYGSISHRITGCILSGGFYIFGFSYLIAPVMGWHLETPSLVAAFASLPVAAKVSAKFVAAFPFVYHSLNGIRHLAWDMGKGFANRTVMKTGWAVVGASVVSSLYLAVAV